MNFVANNRDFHFILSPLNNRKVEAESLVARFEFGGDAKHHSFSETKDSFIFNDKNVMLRIKLLKCCFGNEKIEIIRKECGLDIVFYEGPPRIFNFDSLNQATLIFGLEFAEGEQSEYELIGMSMTTLRG